MSFKNLRKLNDGLYRIEKIVNNNLVFLMYKELLPGSIDPMLDQYEDREVIVIIDDPDLFKIQQETGEKIEGRTIWMNNHHLAGVIKENKIEV